MLSNALKLFLGFIFFLFCISSVAMAEPEAVEDVVKKETLRPINRILELHIESSINPVTYSYLTKAYHKAQQEAFDLVLIRLNTPGGLVSTTKEILTLIGDSPIPTAIWVSPEGASATSAGAIIASSAHVLVMAEGTNIGAATPVGLSEEIKDGDLRNKAINDLLALVESLAQTRGRNKEAYASFVTDAVSLGSREALAAKVIDGIVNNRSELCVTMQGRGVTVQGRPLTLQCQSPVWTTLKMDYGQQLLNALANPNMAYILFLAGVALLYLELQMAGGFIAGSVGAVCLILAAIGFHVLPINFAALGLVLLAFVLFGLELFVTSFGLLTLGGVLALLVGSLFLYSSDDAYISFSQTLVFAVAAVISLFSVVIGAVLWRDFRKQRGRKDYFSLAAKEGVVVGRLMNNAHGHFCYQVKVAGEIWKAESEKEWELGSSCVIQGESKEGLTLLI